MAFHMCSKVIKILSLTYDHIQHLAVFKRVREVVWTVIKTLSLSLTI